MSDLSRSSSQQDGQWNRHKIVYPNLLVELNDPNSVVLLAVTVGFEIIRIGFGFPLAGAH